ncbi:MAG: FG-GAP-like repeat-containing protein [Acidimicrobiales bacterium]
MVSRRGHDDPAFLEGNLTHTLSGSYRGAGPADPFSSPAFGDITGDSIPEVVVANMDGTVQAYRASDRHLLWNRSVGATAIQSSPTLADLSGDGKPDVVVGTMDGRVVWLDGPTGGVVRTFYQGVPQHCPPGVDCRPDGFFASPAVADVNGDRSLDIVAPSFDHSVYVWSKSGRLLWNRFLEDTLWSSPVVTDIDRDGRPEVILGGDIYGGNNIGQPEGGLTWVLRRDGSTYPGYPRSTPGQTVWSSPAVGDLNRDGYPDIVVGTGSNWPEPRGRRVDAFTAKTRANLPGWPVAVDGQVVDSLAIGDIDGDGALEVTFAANGGWVYAYEANGARKWRACGASTRDTCRSGYYSRAGTVIADIDGDGGQEVLTAQDKNLWVFDGSSGAVETNARLTDEGTRATGTSPAVAEVDGKALVIQAVQRGNVNQVSVFTTGHSLCRNDWPQFHRDATRRGRVVNVFDAWLPFACPSTFVRQQYQDFFGRAADVKGSAYWSGKLQTGTQGSLVIRSFMGSPEFERVVAPVVRAYLGVRGTYPPTKATVDLAVARLKRGATAADIAQTFADDPAVAQLSDRRFVTAVFQHLYGRNPTTEELDRDSTSLAGGLRRGSLVARYAEGSAAARLAPQVNVAMVYLGMLGRAPDPGGWRYWVPIARATSTDRIVLGFQRSSEYARRVT